jgi:hypothetical protein
MRGILSARRGSVKKIIVIAAFSFSLSGCAGLFADPPAVVPAGDPRGARVLVEVDGVNLSHAVAARVVSCGADCVELVP